MEVEQTRLELLKWIGRQWTGIREKQGFDSLEEWALKEISHREFNDLSLCFDLATFF